VECVGHADRACYDLDVHSKATKTPMVATQKLSEPVDIEFAKLKFDRKLLGQVFKKDQRVVSGILEALAEDWSDFAPVVETLEKDGKITLEGYEVTKEMVTWTKSKKKVQEMKFVPSVIEPSFGMGRVLYSLLEHSFYQRDADEQRVVMGFNPQVAPHKAAVLPLSSSKEMFAVVDEIAAELMDQDLSTRVDKSSTALGRKYARADEIGVPFAITCDFDTLKDGSVTLRERDSTNQIRLGRDEVVNVIWKFVHGKLTWSELTQKYPLVSVAEGDGQAAATKETTVVVNTGRGRFHRPVK